MLTGNTGWFQVVFSPQGKFPCVKDATGATIVTPACTVNLPVTQPSFTRSNRYNDLAFYGQDSWKLRRDFTLNLGLRWEYYGVQHNSDPNLDSNFYYGGGNTIFDKLRNGAVDTVPNSPIGGRWDKKLNNFGPRLGFAWDVFGDGKTSLRGGYGIAYELNFGNVTFNVIQNPPAQFNSFFQSAGDPAGQQPGTFRRYRHQGVEPSQLHATRQELPTAHPFGAVVRAQFSEIGSRSLRKSGGRGHENRSESGPRHCPSKDPSAWRWPGRRLQRS